MATLQVALLLHSSGICWEMLDIDVHITRFIILERLVAVGFYGHRRHLVGLVPPVSAPRDV